MLELRDVRVVHNRGGPTEVVALDGVQLTVGAGQFVTVVGSNGAGKSSLMDVVSGAQPPTEGQVLIDGRDVTSRPAHRRARYVAHVFDDPRAGTAPDLSIEENLALAHARGRRRGFRLAVVRQRRQLMRERLADLQLGLEDRLRTQVSMLSAGQRQSVTMIMAGLTKPRLLLLDEHLAALDPATQRRVLEFTTDMAAALGCATLMVTHNMQQALDVGDRLLVMSGGRIVADFSSDQKRELAIPDLVEIITAAGGPLSDRLVLQ